jgi:hypothetical protein
VVAFSPRIDYRLLRAIPRFDDVEQPIAETARQVGRLADELGLTRPSYARIREHVLVERELQELRRRRRERILTDVVAGRYRRELTYYTELR